MPVKLRKKLLETEKSQSKHERLVAVIAGTKIPFAEGMRQGYLRDFFAVSENAEFGLSGEYLLPSQYAGQPASVRQSIVLENRLFAEGEITPVVSDQRIHLKPRLQLIFSHPK